MKAAPTLFQSPPQLPDDQFYDPTSTDFKHVLPSLCSPIAQVFDFDVSPLERATLGKIENIRWLADHGHYDLAAKLEYCGTSFIHLKCSHGHHKYLRLFCKSDLCPICGKEGSREHKKRVTRAKDRLSWAPVLGYMIFTLPAEVSASKPSSDKLKLCTDAVIRIIKDHFNTPGGLIRRHDMGNDYGKLHIHFNALFPITNTNGIGAIAPDKLNRIRLDWTKFINECFALNCESSNIHYNFATTQKKMYHKIKYVLRPIVDALSFYTLSDDDKSYILSLKQRHNTRWFGKLSNSTYRKYLLSKNIDPDKYKNSDSYLSRLCPVCGDKFRYIEIIHKSELPPGQFRWLESDIAVDLTIFAKLKENAKQSGNEKAGEKNGQGTNGNEKAGEKNGQGRAKQQLESQKTFWPPQGASPRLSAERQQAASGKKNTPMAPPQGLNG
ncbi:MAG: hypothetical protein PHV77_07360 [Candidatus Omnitrophica bacterium]|nr:hypothetical protein [Candidatus Omnitrophota bacterium]